VAGRVVDSVRRAEGKGVCGSLEVREEDVLRVRRQAAHTVVFGGMVVAEEVNSE